MQLKRGGGGGGRVMGALARIRGIVEAISYQRLRSALI